jgi:hypothetical protein
MKFTVWHKLFALAAILASPAMAQTAPPPSPGLIGWPPKLELGQQWYAAIGKLNFKIELNTKDADGDPSGRASSSDGKSYQVFFYYNKSADLADLYLKSGTGGYRCLFSTQSVNATNPNDTTLVGAAFIFDGAAPKPVDRFKQQQEPCLVTWTNAPNAPATIQTGSPVAAATPAPTPTPPVAPVVSNPPPAPVTPPPAPVQTTATAPLKLPASSLALVWPPKIAANQKWYLAFGKAGYDVTLTKFGANGIGSGTAVSAATKLEAYFYFNSGENRAVMELVSPTSTISCSFNVRGAADKVLNGDATVKTGNANPVASADKCALYLVAAPTTLTLLTQPLV